MKKRTVRLTRLPLLGSVILLGSCHHDKDSNTNGGNSAQTSTNDGDLIVTYDGQEVENGANLTISVGSKIGQLVVDGTTASFASSDDSVLAVDANSGLLNPKAAGTAVITITGAKGSMSLNFTVEAVTVATGVQSYATASYTERAKILASLEKYAVDNYLTGITRFSNGGYVCYNSRYVPAPREYISGYGWGTRREGVLTKAIEHPADGCDPRHYQIGMSSLPQHANAMNSSGSDVSDFDAYISCAFYGNRLNSTKDGYEWIPVLAKEDCPRPIAIGDNEQPNDATLNRRWRIYVRTGNDAPKYATGSDKTNLKKFNGQEVKLEDYLTRLKFRLTQYNSQYRGAELTTGVSGFTGAANYYNHTSKQTGDALWDDNLWNKYRTETKNLFTGEDEKGEYIEFNLLYPCTQFYARYYLSSNLYAPLPKEFLQIVGTTYGQNNDQKGLNPKDTTLSVGPYYIKDWKTSDHIFLSKNNGYHEKVDTFSDGSTRDIYQISGFDRTVVSSQNSILQERFLGGQIDSYSPDKDALDKGTFGSGGTATASGTGKDGRKWQSYKTKADSNFKININATTEEQWNSYFGTKGSVYPHDSSFKASDYCPFYLSNKDFLDFLSFGLDRKSICESRGRTPTQEYLSDNYLIDPENSVSYNSTDAHKAVLADRYNETYGYNADAAKASLKKVRDNVIIPNKKKLKAKYDTGTAGTNKNPYLITLDRQWRNSGDEKSYGGDVFESWTTLANSLFQQAYNGSYEFQVVQHDGGSDYNAVYKKRKQGEFQLGFGAITGNALDPLSFREVLKSDNSSSFTLNWGPDTSKVSDSIVYDGKKWSYDGLWKAGTTVAALDNEGELAQIDNVSTATKTASGTYCTKLDKAAKTITYTLSFKSFTDAGAVIKERMVTSGSKSFSTASLNETGATDKAEVEKIFGKDGVNAVTANNPNLDITLTDTMNSDEGTETAQVVFTVSYTITVNGIDIDSQETIKLPTYVAAIKSK